MRQHTRPIDTLPAASVDVCVQRCDFLCVAQRSVRVWCMRGCVLQRGALQVVVLVVVSQQDEPCELKAYNLLFDIKISRDPIRLVAQGPLGVQCCAGQGLTS